MLTVLMMESEASHSNHRAKAQKNAVRCREIEGQILSSRPRSCVDSVIRCRNFSHSTWLGMSTCTLKSWILFLCLILGAVQPHIITAVDVDQPPPDGGTQRARRSGLRRLPLRELQAITSRSNLSLGLRQDETILLSWRNSSTYLSTNWVENEEAGPCGWPEVSCGDWLGENRVTVVNLNSVNLTGPVPARISGLSALTSLSLASNKLTGNIPRDLGSCSNLQELNLSNNMLTGKIPVELGMPVQLQSLDLSRNRLNGTIPAGFFGTCNNLTSFNVSSNKLSGTLPAELGTCKSLRYLDVGNNSLQGEIPLTLGQLPYLEELVLADCNGFNGSIPDTLLSNCQHLKKLDFAWNQFMGPLPSKLGNCTNLESLHMQENNFSGSIPADFRNLKKLKVLGLGSNNLSGVLPQDMSQCTSLQLLDVGNNGLTGAIPTWLGQLSNLQHVKFQINKFSGTIPVEVTALPELRYLDLSNNSIEGKVLPELGRVTSLRLLRLSHNNLTGNIPSELGNISKLQGLDLSSNFLNGSIPDSIGNLQDLLWLQLGNNSLTGRIPQALTNCSSLMWINLAHNYLRGQIPSGFSGMGWDSERVFRQNRESPWILDGVGECSILSTWSPVQSQHFATLLDVSDSQKRHSCLPVLFQGGMKLRSNRNSGVDKVLSYWNLGRNNLSGTIPDLQNVTTLSFLVLSENSLRGPIPDAVGNLPLYNLNLSHNLLNGSIPSTLGNASLLIALDMANNSLSGPLPPELGNLNALTVLNISYNEKLTGSIPSKGQLTTLGWEPYIGDINLCFNDTDPMYHNAVNLSHSVTNIPKLCSQVLGYATSATNDKDSPATRRQKIMRALETTCISTICTLSALLLVSRLYCVVSNRRKRLLESKKAAPAHGFWDGVMASTGKYSSYRWRVLDKSSSQIAVASFGTPCLESLTYAHLLAATENFSDDNIVGDGGFGIVYRARLASGMTVAIKKLIQNGTQGPREFHAEMETLGTIQHENLVCLLGYCCNDEEMILVYEYLMNGSLDDWLYESEEKASQLDWPLRFRIALETARGLAFLHHQCVHLIIHRDMKSSNILLNENFKAVLTDFGMARIMDTGCTHVSTIVAGTPGYVPPEYSQTWRATTKGDVYSFGVVMLELLSGKRPTGPHFNGRCGSNLIEMARLLVTSGRPTEVCDRIVLGSGATRQISEFLDLAIRCTEVSPASRPTMLQVVETLQGIAGPQAPPQTLVETRPDFGRDGDHFECTNL